MTAVNRVRAIHLPRDMVAAAVIVATTNRRVASCPAERSAPGESGTDAFAVANASTTFVIRSIWGHLGVPLAHPSSRIYSDRLEVLGSPGHNDV